MYASFAAEYDRFVNWNNRLAFEMPFLEKTLQGIQNDEEKKATVLDAACGTGRHALALAQRGYEASGADLSREMVRVARQNVRRMGLSLRFEQAGFGEYKRVFGAAAFDGILCLGNSLPHLLTEDALDAALLDFAACLHPRGVVILQNLNYAAILKSQSRWLPPQEYVDKNGQWIYQRFYDFNTDGTLRFNIVTLQRTPRTVWKSRVVSTSLRPLLFEEMQPALEKAGFRSIQNYGGLDGSPYDPASSGNLVLTACKA